MDIALDKSFESWGTFWNVEHNDTPTDVAGRVYFQPGNPIRVEFAGLPPGATLKNLMRVTLPRTLVGRLVDGTSVTLIGCAATLTAAGAGRIGLPTQIYAERIVFGALLPSIDQLNVSAVTMSLSSLANWVNAKPLAVEVAANDGGSLSTRASYRTPEPIVACVEQRGLSLRIAYEVEQVQSMGEFELRWRAGFSLRTNRPILFDKISRDAWQCKCLFELLIGSPLNVLAFSIEPSCHSESNVDDGRKMLPNLFEQSSDVNARSVHAREMLAPYNEVKDSFETILNRWFERSEQAILASDIFFDPDLSRTSSPTFRFLAISQAMESYHRCIDAGTYVSAEQYKVHLGKMTKMLPDELTKEHRAALKERLKWGNEISFRKRINALLERLPCDLKAAVVATCSQFVSRVVDTRNFLTHYSAASRGQVLEGVDLLIATERLRAVLVANLLLDLGLDSTKLYRAILRNRGFQQWLSREFQQSSH